MSTPETTRDREQYESDSSLVWWAIHTGAGMVANAVDSASQSDPTATSHRRAYAYLMSTVVAVHLSRCVDTCFARYLEWVAERPLDPARDWTGEQYERWAYELHVHANEQKEAYHPPPLEFVRRFYAGEMAWWRVELGAGSGNAVSGEGVFRLVTVIPRVPPELWREARRQYRTFDQQYGTPPGW